MNSECQASSVTTRAGSCEPRVGAAEQILDEQVACRAHGARSRRAARRNAPATSPCCCPTRPAARSAASRTMNLSLGERPVWRPVSGDQRAVGAEPRLAAARSPLVELRPAEIVADDARGSETHGADAAGRIASAQFDHCCSPADLPRLPALAEVRNGRDCRRLEEPEKRNDFKSINRFKNFENCLNRLYSAAKIRLAKDWRGAIRRMR